MSVIGGLKREEEKNRTINVKFNVNFSNGNTKVQNSRVDNSIYEITLRNKRYSISCCANSPGVNVAVSDGKASQLYKSQHRHHHGLAATVKVML